MLHEAFGAVHIHHHQVPLTLRLLEKVMADRQVVLRGENGEQAEVVVSSLCIWYISCCQAYTYKVYKLKQLRLSYLYK